MTELTRRIRANSFLALLCLSLFACAGGKPPEKNPWRRAFDGSRGHAERVQAIGEAWGNSSKTPEDAALLSEIYWAKSTPRDVRLGLLETLNADPEGHDELQQLLAESLPFETDPPVMQRACDLAVEHGWRGLSQPLVRSLSRRFLDVPDESRPEAIALLALHPDQGLVAIVLEVAGSVPAPLGKTPEEQRMARRPMIDAWSLASRLDLSGEARQAWLRDPANGGFLGGTTRRALDDFGILAQTGEELGWIEDLAAPGGDSAAWWDEAAQAVRAAGGGEGALELRHLEALRWTQANQPQRLAQPREELFRDLDTRLKGRAIRVRSSDQIHTDGPNRERPRDWAERLGRFDLLTILALDDLMATPRVRAALPEYVRLDRDDRTTEYGGVVAWRAGSDPELVLYPPRPEERVGDDQFVASTDMFQQHPHALAHFHFHVQPGTTSAKAGPSRGDLVQAARSGRTSLVFTTINPRTLNVDLYQPDGAVIDLGEVTLGGP